MTARTAAFDAAWDDIVSGHLLIIDFGDVTERIERCADLMKRDGVKLEELTELQRGTVKLMIDRQIAIGILEGHFNDVLEGL